MEMLPTFSIKGLPFGARPEVALEPKVCSESCNAPKVTRRLVTLRGWHIRRWLSFRSDFVVAQITLMDIFQRFSFANLALLANDGAVSETLLSCAAESLEPVISFKSGF
jgi:hypothetical protein